VAFNQIAPAAMLDQYQQRRLACPLKYIDRGTIRGRTDLFLAPAAEPVARLPHERMMDDGFTTQAPG
jgi:hypothetical protein